MGAFRSSATLVLILAVGLSPQAAITFDSSIECGNGTSFTRVGANEYSFEIEPDTGGGAGQWFHFRVDGAQGQTLTFRLRDTDQTYDPRHWDHGRPMASADGGVTWRRVSGPTSHAEGVFTFTHAVASAEELLALITPHTHTRLQARLAEWETHPDCTRRVIGTSVQGRAIELLAITDPTSEPDGGKRGLWIIARQHSGEPNASWMCEGFIDSLLSKDSHARLIRRGAVTMVVPMVNPDGVVLGNLRANALGTDLNRAWLDPDPSVAPEVHAVSRAIDEWVEAGGSYDFFADLHGHESSLSNFAYHAAPGIMPPSHHQDLRRILALVAKHSADFDPDEGESSSTDQSLSRQRQMLQHGVPAFIFEQTFLHTDHGPQAGEPMTAERHRAVGEALAKALQEHFFPSPSASR